MSFISPKYFVFILLICIIYALTKKKYRYIVLLIASMVFYYLNSNVLLLFLILSITSIYFGGKYIGSHDKHQKLVMNLVILFNLGLLVYCKYTNFFIDIINNLFHGNISMITLLLPLGMSYYTLSSISYIVDVKNGKIEYENNYLKLALYLSYFPYILEGPITKYREIKDTLYAGNLTNYEGFRKAFILYFWGLFKKLVIADRCALYVNTVFANHNNGWNALIAMALYTLEIYAEFSGCMDIVKATSELFEIKVPDNFKQPFFSTNINEFWRRWHITLGTWLKEYIFYPISLSKANMNLLLKTSKWKNQYLANFVRVAFPLIFVWLAMGIWHGASIKYILYGLYYYVIMMIGVLLKPLFKKENKIFSIARTILIVVIGMTIFRSDTFIGAFQMIGSIFEPMNASVLSLGLKIQDFILLILCIILLVIIDLKNYHKIDIREWIENHKLWVRWLIYFLLIFGVFTLGIYGEGYDASSFIYGGF